MLHDIPGEYKLWYTSPIKDEISSNVSFLPHLRVQLPESSLKRTQLWGSTLGDECCSQRRNSEKQLLVY